MVMAPLVEIVSKPEFEDLKSQIEGALSGALRFLGRTDCRVSVALLYDEEISLLNKKTKGREGPAAVLSFEEPEEIPQVEKGAQYLGEIYLAPHTIKRKEMNPSMVAVHGLLHLLGYTHKRRSDTMKMESLEDEIIEAIDIDN